MSNTERIKKIFSYVFIIGLSLVFILAFSLTGGSLAGGLNQVVGKVNGQVVKHTSTSLFNQTYRQILDDWQRKEIQITKEMEHFAKQQAFSYIAQRMVVREFANKHHLHIKDQTLVNFIKGSFVDEETGNFRSVDYENFKRGAGMLRKQRVEEAALMDITVMLTYNTLFSDVPVSSHEVLDRMETGRFYKKAKIAYTPIDDKLENYIEEPILKEYYQKNRDRFSGTYEEMVEEVRADYVNNNSELLFNRVQADYTAKIHGKKEALMKDFDRTVSLMGMRIVQTDWFNYYSQELTDSQGNVVSDISANKIAKELMLFDKGEVSTMFSENNVLGVALITHAKTSRSSTENSSDFVMSRYKDDLKQHKQRSLIAAFRDNLLKLSKIENKLTP